jgi:hypothetical protein
MLPGAAPFFLINKIDITLITLSRQVIVIIILSALILALLAVIVVSLVYEESISISASEVLLLLI